MWGGEAINEKVLQFSCNRVGTKLRLYENIEIYFQTCF